MNVRALVPAAILMSLAVVQCAHAQAARSHGIPDPITITELQRLPIGSCAVASSGRR